MAVFVLDRSGRPLMPCGDGYGYSQVAKMDVTGTLPQHKDASHPALYLPGLKAEVSRAN